MDRVKFDLELFSRLNQEYASKPTAPRASEATVANRGPRRAQRLDAMFDIRGKRVLDVGCGRGALALQLAQAYDCHVTGVDIQEYSEWSQLRHPRLRLRKLDLTQ